MNKEKYGRDDLTTALNTQYGKLFCWTSRYSDHYFIHINGHAGIVVDSVEYPMCFNVRYYDDDTMASAIEDEGNGRIIEVDGRWSREWIETWHRPHPDWIERVGKELFAIVRETELPFVKARCKYLDESIDCVEQIMTTMKAELVSLPTRIAKEQQKLEKLLIERSMYNFPVNK